MPTHLTTQSPRTRFLRGLQQAMRHGEVTTHDYLLSQRLIATRLAVARGTPRAATATSPAPASNAWATRNW